MKLVWHEETYDDETGRWVEQDGVDESFLEVDLVWARESDLLERRDRPFARAEAFSLCAGVILNDFSVSDLPGAGGAAGNPARRRGKIRVRCGERNKPIKKHLEVSA